MSALILITIHLVCLVEIASSLTYLTPWNDELLANCSFSRNEVYSPTCQDGRTKLNDTGRVGLCEPTLVDLRLMPERFHGIDDPTETLTIAGSLLLQWELKCPNYWKSYEFSFNADPTAFWKPQVYHANSLNNYAMAGDSVMNRFVAIYYPDKRRIKFKWQMFGFFTSTCEFDYARFPFDTQECQIIFGLQEQTVAVQFKLKSISLLPQELAGFMGPGENWHFLGSKTQASWFGDPNNMEANRSSATVMMRFKRRPEFWFFSLMVPSFLLTILQLISFTILPDLTDRSMFCVTILLASTFMQAQVIARLPAKPHRSFLANYTDICALFCCGITIYSLTAFALAMTWPKYYRAKVELGYLFKGIALTKWLQSFSINVIRLMDIFAFIASFLCLCTVNLYAYLIFCNIL